MKAKHCSWCDSQFETDISYQIYCSSECREQATKEKIAERYNKVRRQRLLKKDRFCKTCNTKLSSYNDDKICNACLIDASDVLKALKEIKRSTNGSKDTK